METYKQLGELLRYIKHHQDGEVVSKMNASGIVYNMNYGLSLYLLMQKAKQIGRNHELALLLRKEAFREAQLLYFMIEEPSYVDATEMEKIVNDFTNYELAEIACLHLFPYCENAIDKIKQWTKSGNEYVRMSGFTLIGRLIMKQPDIEKDKIHGILYIFDTLPENGSLFEKRSICFALSVIAKFGLKYEVEAINNLLGQNNSAVAQFVYKNTIEELKYV